MSSAHPRAFFASLARSGHSHLGILLLHGDHLGNYGNVYLFSSEYFASKFTCSSKEEEDKKYQISLIIY